MADVCRSRTAPNDVSVLIYLHWKPVQRLPSNLALGTGCQILFPFPPSVFQVPSKRIPFGRQRHHLNILICYCPTHWDNVTWLMFMSTHHSQMSDDIQENDIRIVFHVNVNTWRPFVHRTHRDMGDVEVIFDRTPLSVSKVFDIWFGFEYIFDRKLDAMRLDICSTRWSIQRHKRRIHTRRAFQDWKVWPRQ